MAFDTAAAASWLRITDETQMADLAVVVAAVVSMIDDTASAPRKADGSWGDQTELAARMLAGRLFRRRNSPNGIESFGEVGGATYVARYDPDIARMLRLDYYTPPQVG